MYVDDLGQACWRHMSVLRIVEDELAVLLGLLYKHSKDVFYAKELKFIGFMIRVTADSVDVAVPTEFITKLQ